MLGESKNRPGAGGGKNSYAPRPACRARTAPRPLVPEGPPHPSVSQEQQFGEGAERHWYICGSHFSETQLRSFQGKALGQGRRVSTVGGAKYWPGGICLPLRKGQRGELLPESYGVLGAAGQAGSVMLVGCLGTLGAAGRGRAGE